GERRGPQAARRAPALAALQARRQAAGPQEAREAGPQRPLLLRVRQEVQEVPRRGVALWCAAAGVALALTLPKPGLCFLGWVAPGVLVYHAARAATWRSAAVLGLLFGSAFVATALHWVFLTCRFAGMPLAASLVAWGALTAVLAFNWGVFAALGRAALGGLPDAARPWAWAVLWAALEHASSRWTPRFELDFLSYTQWRHPALVQLGALAGPHALGFLVMAVNAALAGAFERRTRAAFAGALFAAGAVLFAAGSGLMELAGRPPTFRPGAAAVILQPNVDQYRKWDERFAGDIRDTFERLLAAPVPAGALVVWPESALPGWLDDPENAAWMADRARAARAPMVVGAVADWRGKNHNAAVLVNTQGEAAGLYAKRRLVPFGEFVPLRGLLQPFIGILAELGDFDAGDAEQALWATPLGTAAVTLCYEAMFPRLTLADAARGARVFLNLTNDGWYKDTWAPAQHFEVNVFRAVESRSYVVRSANTGISGVVDPWGVILASAPAMTQGRLDVVLPAEDPFPRRSPYARSGDWFGLACLAVAGALAAFGLRRRA
ncbi:apolipoprotein N-acyltransferase, partial [bacterium]